jgi:hypothetical protein
VLQRAAARFAPSRGKPPTASKRREIAQIGIRDEDDVAAAAAVTAVGTALRDMLLTPEVEAAVAAAPRLHVNAGAVVKHALLLRAVDFDEALLADGVAWDAV